MSDNLETREFHISDILSVTTDKLVSTRHMDGVYDILNYMTGDNLFTHQLPRAGKECKPFLLQQHPELEKVDANNVNQDNWAEWLNEQIEIFGEKLPVTPIPESAHRMVNPIDELESMILANK